nr:MAG TPA: hypothetical protein [Caudoviricetes sp.]
MYLLISSNPSSSLAPSLMVPRPPFLTGFFSIVYCLL